MSADDWCPACSAGDHILDSGPDSHCHCPFCYCDFVVSSSVSGAVGDPT